MRAFFIFLLSVIATGASAQRYADSTRMYLKSYMDNHQVIKGTAKAGMQFFEVNEAYRVIASFEKKENATWFQMESSGPIKKLYRVYGIVKFTLNNNTVQLNVYQSQDLLQNEKYQNYLFLPFTDATTGAGTYEGGRYIDLTTSDIRENTVAIDFNKAYNPYCAYVSNTYSCPVPPQENHLQFAIKAGEKAYVKD
jgi:uncharacterized protein